MSSYRVEVLPLADKQLAKVKDRVLKARLLRTIYELGNEPRPTGCVKLVGEIDQWRVRVGDWRIVYMIEDGRLVVVVVRVAPRGGVYG
ncbi:MAG: type II toxin-antitoxin system RelE/ParE family toxin [Tabrizicola sp.]|uniref:type II toxin-antitoxin system RelE family toxin n=1 Tax=Tabrizicola sp. TaxID=2005166 RepID=UPI0027347565|nr:type II toxin-antitoxin system RelE/ParE family toxin [Tabrizicola sp.]MDP3263068.1 type II toxin-antitoxin system RelE/ParE family toxin [Tabrizicola sp.]MDP3648603.1 type II toxin-antitoxin system RelE/ParE family toxin [Paracoccaceae bacterium]MDZ4066823.1 type II toxin-antitoxin system RelE/ParE family toxin [Tabrizicola sp.]